MIQSVLYSLGSVRTLRFRRWSRKGYAAFATRHCQVTIGHLSASVSERLRGKSEDIILYSRLMGCLDDCIDDEWVGEEVELLNLEVQSISSSAFVSPLIKDYFSTALLRVIDVGAWCRKTLGSFFLFYNSI